MLEVLARCPVAAPLEASLGEEAEAEVVVVYLVGEVPRAIAVCLGSSGLDVTGAVGTVLVVGVVERVDVDGQSAGVLRELGGAGDGAVAEGRRVVVAHLRLIVCIIHVGQQHPLDGVLGVEQLAQDGGHTVSNLLVHYHLAHMHLTIVVPMQGADVTQVITPDVRVFLIGLALHTLPYTIGDRVGGEAIVYAAKGFDGLLTHGSTSLSLGKGFYVDGKGKVGLYDTLAVDGLEVIAHGDDMIPGLAPLLAQREGFFAVGMVALVVVGNEHEGCRLIVRVAERIVVHGCVAAAVAERQHRHFANLLGNLLHLVRL